MKPRPRARLVTILILLALTALVGLAAGPPQGSEPVTAIVGATIIDGNGGDLVQDGTLVVTGRRISAVGPRASVRIPQGAKIIDDLNNIRKISVVMQGGAVIDRDKLPVTKVLTAPRPTLTRVLIETELGEIEVEVDSGRAPTTAGNFMKYVEGGYYDGGRFHRTVRMDNQPTDLIKIEVVQASANPDTLEQKKTFPPIPLERTKDTGLLHKDGAISMARGAPDTATQSFFICLGDQPALDFEGMRNPDGQGFAAFGWVVRGMDVVRKIHGAPSEKQALTPPITIIKITTVPDSPVETK